MASGAAIAAVPAVSDDAGSASAGDTIAGQVVHRRRCSRKLCFLDVIVDGARICVVAKSEVAGVATACGLDGVRAAASVRCGDTVRAGGSFEAAAADGAAASASFLCDGRVEILERWAASNGPPFVPVPPPPSARAPVAEPCKYFVNTGACVRGGACRYAHGSGGGGGDGRDAAAWVAAKRDARRALRGDDLASHDEARNSGRHRAVAEFLVAKFGRAALENGPVLDVAGGRGELAFELQVVHGIAAVLVEPRDYGEGRLTRRQRKALKRRGESDASDLVPRHVRAAAPVAGAADAPACGPPPADLVASASVLVGCHPDEATEWIVDSALAANKRFCVVPCCVFPSLFPDRIHPETAAPVVSHGDFCDYLAARRYANGAGAVSTARLPIAGRNVCIWGDPDG